MEGGVMGDWLGEEAGERGADVGRWELYAPPPHPQNLYPNCRHTVCSHTVCSMPIARRRCYFRSWSNETVIEQLSFVWSGS